MKTYFLMNKDNIVASFSAQPELGGIRLIEAERFGTMPLGYKSIDTWIANRNAAKHNKYLRALINQLGGNKLEHFISLTHATSINDTFWIKESNEQLTWKDVSLYTNEFSDVISKLAFEGYGIPVGEISTTSPELTTEGSFRKCFRRENGEIFLYKRGQSEGRNAGLEPYCEALSSQLTNKLCPHAVKYEITQLHNEIASRCRLFTNEKYGYVSYGRICPDQVSFSDTLKFFEQIGAEDEFRRMIVSDCLLFNVDRHAGNYGVLIDNDTQQIVSFAPVFDLNLALLPYVEQQEFTQIGDKLLEMGPKIGDDFVQVGQEVMTDEIRTDLNELKDFTFEFEGDERFTKERVDILNQIVHKQINAILSPEKLQTKDVFVPEQYLAKIKSHDLAKENMEAFIDRLEQSNLKAAYSIVDDIDNVTIYIEPEPQYNDCFAEIKLDFIGNKGFCEINGIPVEEDRLKRDHDKLYNLYGDIIKLANNERIIEHNEHHLGHDI